MGVTIRDLGEAIHVKRDAPLRRANIKTMPYPGFPTDMQPQLGAVLCLAGGTSIITESIWDNRYRYLDELKKMGATVQVDGKTAVIEGVPCFTGAPVSCCDLRAGAALVIAGLAAQGETIVEQIHYIERGYEDLVGKMRSLGADIEYLKEPIDPEKESTLRAIS